MAEELEDPREVPWHPRLAPVLQGQEEAWSHFIAAFASGKPHHAWLLTGNRGIGKATLAYKIAEHVLSQSNPAQTARWIASRAHPDLFVLERSFNDAKPRRLRQEIAVADARQMSEFFARTSASGGWRVAIVDSADELNTEAANALLKLIEEPPSKALILLVSHRPGRLLRTLRSRCRRLAVAPLPTATTVEVLQALPLADKPGLEAQRTAATLSAGSPGRALELLNSAGAKAFDAFLKLKSLSGGAKFSVANNFSQRQAAVADFETFTDLLLNWLAQEAVREAESARSSGLALAHQQIATARGVVAGYNLDRRVAVLNALSAIEDALKAA